MCRQAYLDPADKRYPQMQNESGGKQTLALVSKKLKCARFMTICVLAALSLYAAGTLFNSAHSQTDHRTAAMVNDEVISAYDLESRVTLILMSSRLPNEPNVRNRFRPQVLRNLIDERLRLQEAKRLGIKVDKTQVSKAIADIERRNNMPAGRMPETIRAAGLDMSVMEESVESQIAWTRVVRAGMGRNVSITPQDIDEAIARIEVDKGKPEHLISEIFLPSTADRSEAQTKQFAQRLVEQIRDGANFGALARSFSQSATKERGGSLGWIREDRLDDNVAKIVTRMKPGQLSLPIKGADGYYIVVVRNRRISQGLRNDEIILSLEQLFVSLKPGTNKEAVDTAMAQIQKITAPLNGCAAMAAAGKKHGSNQSGALSGINLKSLPANMRSAVQDIPIGKASVPLKVSSGIVVLMVCDRQGQETDQQIRERVRNIIFEQRAELVGRRITRDLRRSAFIQNR